MNRAPKPQLLDWILEVLGLVTLLSSVVFLIYHYGNLPDTIPRHFNAAGEPDGFSKKGIIWLLPLIAIGLYAGLIWLSRLLTQPRFLPNIPDEQIPSYLRLITRFIRWLKLIIVALFGYLMWGSIQVALGHTDTLSPWLLPVTIAVFGTTLAWLIVKSRRFNRANKTTNRL